MARPAKGKEDGRIDMIRFLVEHGADINAKDRYGMTSLQIALGDPEGRYARQIGAIAPDIVTLRPRERELKSG